LRIDISTCIVTLSPTTYTYDETAKEPTVTVKNENQILTAGTDYNVVYSDNKNAGEASVKVEAIDAGHYKGTANANFTISKADAGLRYVDSTLSKKTTDAAFTNVLTKATPAVVTYVSNDPSVATVDNKSGLVTIMEVGTVTITASSEATPNYNAGSISYTLTVIRPAPASTSGFSDVQDLSHPYYNAIYWAAEKNITKGYSDGTFGINRSCTRGEMMMFLWRFAGKPAPKAVSKSPFKDVPKTHTFYKPILWGYQKGITKGYSDGTFGINRNVSRGEAIMFLWKLKGRPAPKAVSKSPFKDVPMNHAFYKAILWGSQKKITVGYTSGPKKGNFGINDNCTRGQIVKFCCISCEAGRSHYSGI